MKSGQSHLYLCTYFLTICKVVDNIKTESEDSEEEEEEAYEVEKIVDYKRVSCEL